MLQIVFSLSLVLAPPGSTQIPSSGDSTVADKPGLAVLDLTAGYGAKPELAKFLNEIMLTALRQTNRFSTVIAGSDIKQMLDLEQQKTALGCEETSCLAELGGALGVPFLASGQLGKLGNSYRITVKLISVDDGQVLAREMGKAKDEESAAELLQALVTKAAASIDPAGKDVTTVTPDAQQPPSAKASTSWQRPLGIGLVATALGLAGWRWSQFLDRQTAYENEPTPVHADEYVAAAGSAQWNLWISGGLSAAGLYLVLGPGR